MRVAHVMTNLHRGGAQRAVVDLVAAAPASVEVHIVTGVDGDAAHSFLGPMAALLGERLHVLRDLVRAVAPVTDTRAVLALRRICRDERFDVIHTHMSKGGVLGRLAATAAGTPVVVHTVHGWSTWYSPNPAIRRSTAAIERLSARWCDAILVSSAHDESVARGIGLAPTRLRWIGTGVDVTAPAVDRATARARLGLPIGGCIVGTVTRLVPTKRVVDVVRAAAIVTREEPGTRFLVVGDGPELAGLRSLAASLGIEGVIDFRPATSEALTVLAALDVFVHASAFEGLPRIVLEAMSAGVPVVAEDVGATREVVIDGRTGQIVPVGDVAALADAALVLLRDRRLASACAAAARQLVEERHDAAVIAAGQYELYERLLAEAAMRKTGPMRSMVLGRAPAASSNPRSCDRRK